MIPTCLAHDVEMLVCHVEVVIDGLGREWKSRWSDRADQRDDGLRRNMSTRDLVQRTRNRTRAVGSKVAMGVASKWTDAVEHISESRRGLVRLEMSTNAVLARSSVLLFVDAKLLHHPRSEPDVIACLYRHGMFVAAVSQLAVGRFVIDFVRVALEKHLDRAVVGVFLELEEILSGGDSAE
jgi:hypothetical protein